LAPKATEFGEITQNNGHYAVLRHVMSPVLVPCKDRMRLPINNSNLALHSISHFRDIVDYWLYNAVRSG